MFRSLLVLLIVLSLAGCGGETDVVRDVSTLNRGLSAAPESLDPQLARSVPALTVLADVYEGLLTRDASGVLVAGVASDWRLSDDGLRYEFTIDPAARWSDGTPVTSADFVRAWRFLVDPKNGAFYGELLTAVTGFDEIRRGDSPVSALGVTAPRDDQLIVSLTVNQPDFLERVAMPALAPRATSTGLFNGAYVVKSTDLSEIVLAQNGAYASLAGDAFATVRYQVFEQEQTELVAFESGDLDITSRVPRSLLRDPGKLESTLRRTPYLGIVYLNFNLREPLDVRLREALYLSVDRDALATQIVGRGEQPAWTMVPAGTRLGDTAYRGLELDVAALDIDRRIERARELVANMESLPVVQIDYASNDENRVVAAALQQMWQTALPGLEVKLNNQEFRVVLSQARAGKFPGLVRSSWIADYNDPQQFLELFRSGAPGNTSGFANPMFDVLLDRAAAVRDPQSRQQALNEAESLLHESFVAVPLYTMVSKHLVHQRLIGWEDNPLDLHLSRYLRVEAN